MLDRNSLTLAIIDLQLWVLGPDLISDMPVEMFMNKSHCGCCFRVEVCIECAW